MTAKAREVLDDCRLALALLEEETDLRRWRVHWFGALALVRAVGHVLKEIDCKDAAIKKWADDAFWRWRSEPEHEIFRDFIKRERDNILKEYRFNIHPDEEVQIAWDYTLQPIDGGEPVRLVDLVPIGDNIYRPLMEGYREGDDARDVLADAIIWWDKELAKIENKIGEQNESSSQGRI